MSIKQQFKEGIITNNPVLVQLIGMCATMAITTSMFNGVGMGLSVLIILTCCNVVVSLIRKIIPNEIRLAIFVVVIAGFVTLWTCCCRHSFPHCPKLWVCSFL